MQSESKCFRGLRHSKSRGSELGEGLASLVMKKATVTRAQRARGKGHAMGLEHGAGPGLHSTFQAMVKSLDLTRSSTGSH